MGVAPDSTKKGNWEDLESEAPVVAAPVAEVDETPSFDQNSEVE